MDDTKPTTDDQNVKGSQPVISPTTGTKEAPVGAPITEWVSPSTPEIVLPQEVKAVGVEAKSVVENISESAKQAGVRMASHVATVATVKAEVLDLKTSRNVLEHLKGMHKNVKDGLSWLVRLIIREQEKQKR